MSDEIENGDGDAGDPDAERLANRVRAWELATGNDPDHLGVTMSTRQVAKIVGVSQPTASRWIKEAREADAFIDLLDRAENRLAQADRLRGYLERVIKIVDDPNDARDILDALPSIMKVEERWARLGGLDAPTRIQNETPNGAPEPDVELVRALAEARQTNAADRRSALGPGTVSGEVADDDAPGTGGGTEQG